jgi:hypothetical protein
MTKWKKENSRAVDFKSALKEGLSIFLRDALQAGRRYADYSVLRGNGIARLLGIRLGRTSA